MAPQVGLEPTTHPTLATQRAFNILGKIISTGLISVPQPSSNSLKCFQKSLPHPVDQHFATADVPRVSCGGELDDLVCKFDHLLIGFH